MRHSSTILGLGAAAAVLALYTACSDGAGSPNSDAGLSQPGTGGAATSSGGSSSVGDTGGSSTVSTVSSSTGGTPAASSTDAVPPIVVNDFSESQKVGQFQASTYVDKDCSVNVAVPNDAGRSVEINWSGSVDVDSDATNKGAMKVTATFDNWNEYWEVDMTTPTDKNGDPVDLTGKLVTAQVKVASGLSPNASYPYGAVLFIKTGSDYVWGASRWTNLESTSGFITLTLDATSPQGVPDGKTWDPTAPAQLGIKVGTGGAGETTYCTGNYGAPFGPAQTTVAYIDDIRIKPRPQ